ncbi:MAG: hypothetical protein HYX73_07820 [Acidobacteria bacterium]|nr:hypothetical protein [Acidobacteriota bacterium]
MLAVINRQTESVSILIAAGADRETRGSGATGFAGLTALELAEKAGYEEVAALLRSSAE